MDGIFFFSKEKKNRINQINLYITPSIFKYLPCAHMNENNKKKISFYYFQKAFFSLIICTLKKINTCFNSILAHCIAN